MITDTLALQKVIRLIALPLVFMLGLINMSYAQCPTTTIGNFSSGSAGWSTGSLGGANSWQIRTTSGTGIGLGDTMYGVPHSGNGSTEHSFLQSPVFNSTGGGTVYFDFFVNNETGTYDQEIIEVSFNGGGTWTQVIGNQLPNATTAQSTSFAITAAQGTNNTRVRFVYNTVDGCCGPQDGFLVDDILFDGVCCDISLNSLVKTDEVCPGANNGTITVTASCTSCASIQYSIGGAFQASNTFSGLTPNTYTVTIRDSANPSCNDVGSITVGAGSDSTNPSISCPGNVNTTTNTGCTATGVSLGTPTTADNCTVASVTNNAPAAFPLGNTTVTWTVTDPTGNTATCNQTVTVTDNDNPTITCPANVNTTTNTGCTATGVSLGTPTTADNCTVASVTNNAPAAFPLGNTTVTWTVTDPTGNTATCNQIVTVTDDDNPTITCPANITQNVDPGSCDAIVTYATPTTDNCPGQTTAQTAGIASGGTFPVGTTTNTFTVTDASGNTASCSFTVTVNDNENPTITCPGNITQNVDPGSCDAVVTYVTPTTDNCPGQTTAQTAGIASGGIFPVGTTTNTFTVTDAAGNTTTCSFNVTVADTENPTISCPADISVNSDPGVCGAVVTFATPTGADNCPGQTVALTGGMASGSTFPIGNTVNTFTVTDATGNTATCSFNVMVTDNEAPTISCPADITMGTDVGNCDAIVTFTTPTEADNCPGQTVALTGGLPSGSTFPIGITTNTFTVTDASGNTASCSFNITVADTEDPTISCPADIIAPTDPGECFAVLTYTAPTGADNCPGETIIQTEGLASGAAFPAGTTTNIFEITDAAGNTATCSFDIVVTLNGLIVSMTSPVNTACTDDVLTNLSGGQPPVGTNPGDAGTYTGLGVTDNGNGTFDFDAGAAGVGSHIVAYTYNNGIGCLAGATDIIEVYESPVASITCPDAVLKDCQGPFNCSPTDINPTTLPSSTGSVSGSAAAYIYGDPNPGGDLFINLPNMPTDTEFELIYTLTSPDGCSSTASCTFEIKGKLANAGKF